MLYWLALLYWHIEMLLYDFNVPLWNLNCQNIYIVILLSLLTNWWYYSIVNLVLTLKLSTLCWNVATSKSPLWKFLEVRLQNIPIDSLKLSIVSSFHVPQNIFFSFHLNLAKFTFGNTSTSSFGTVDFFNNLFAIIFPSRCLSRIMCSIAEMGLYLTFWSLLCYVYVRLTSYVAS